MKFLAPQIYGGGPVSTPRQLARLPTFSPKKRASSSENAVAGLRLREQSPAKRRALLLAGTESSATPMLGAASVRIPGTQATRAYLKALRAAEMAAWNQVTPAERSLPAGFSPGLVEMTATASQTDVYERRLYALLGMAAALAVGSGILSLATDSDGLGELALFVSRLLGGS